MNNIIHSQSVFSRFAALDVKYAINKLKMGKTAGTDSMKSEHVKYAHSKVTGLLSMLCNAMFLHKYISCKIMETVIVPIIKNK